MNILTKPLFLHRNSTFEETLHVEGDTKGFRASAYVKLRRSSPKILATFDCRLNESNILELGLPANRSGALPIGQFIYFIELTRGVSRFVQSDYIEIE